MEPTDLADLFGSEGNVLTAVGQEEVLLAPDPDRESTARHGRGSAAGGRGG